jgi:hypothetical protein
MPAAAVLLVAAVAVNAKDYFLFAYFEEPAKSGVYYALSTDGYHWNPINSARRVFAPQYPGELMRDVFIARGPDGEFHAVWTWGWRERRIGYAHSADLIHWSPQQQVPLMEKVPGTVHTWAPEIYWDKASSRWLILWSSITAEESRNPIFYSFTRDFRDFTPPVVFFDPGYDVIDATILRDRSRYVRSSRIKPRTRCAFSSGWQTRRRCWARGVTSAIRSRNPGRKDRRL